MAATGQQEGLRRAAALAAFAVGYLFAYFLSTAVPTKLLWHLPLERRFTFEVRPLALGADFYGRVLLSLLAGAVSMLLARGALRGSSAESLRRWLHRLLGWTLVLLVFTAGLYVYLLASRQPIPAPLPPGYVTQ